MPSRRSIDTLKGSDDPARTLNRLVGVGFRCGRACIDAKTAAEATSACDALWLGIGGYGLAPETADDFLAWCLAVECEATRRIVTLPLDAEGLSRDEALAVSLVAACQHQACPALRACAYALLGTEDGSRTLAATSGLACRLLAEGRRLSPMSLADVAATTDGLGMPWDFASTGHRH